MGFISSSNTIDLTAFYTQKGRAYYLNGQDKDKKIFYFSLGDSDTNYITAANSNITTETANILESGTVPDVSGNYDSCVKTVADGTETSSFIFYKATTGLTNTHKEIRFFTPTNNDYSGKNELDVKVDLGKYIAWLKQYSAFSTNITDHWNKNEPNLSSAFIKFYDYIGIYDSVSATIDTDTPIYFNLSEGDYKTFDQLNRFFVDYTQPNKFRVVTPNSLKQSSPLTFLFSSSKATTNAGQGTGGMMINNRDYGYYLLNKTTNETTYYPYTASSQPLTLTVGVDYEYRPYVGLNYYNNGTLNKEVFKLRTTKLNIFGSNLTDKNNQYLKLFVNDNKTLATREAELLQDFILNRTDLFYSSGTKYYSKPVTIYIKTSDTNTSIGSLKISLYYDASQSYTNLSPNETFLI